MAAYVYFKGGKLGLTISANFSFDFEVFFGNLRCFWPLCIAFGPFTTATSCQDADFFPGMIRRGKDRQAYMLTFWQTDRHKYIERFLELKTMEKKVSSREKKIGELEEELDKSRLQSSSLAENKETEVVKLR